MDALEHIIRATWKCQLLLLITRALFQKKWGIQHRTILSLSGQL